MTCRDAFDQLQLSLRKIYNNEESVLISQWVLENITGVEKKGWTPFQNKELNKQQEDKFLSASNELLNHKPVQYVLNESWFYDLKLYVDENVLIPRPETEELVAWVVLEAKKMKEDIRILDIGTGSGCIALALKNKLPGANVTGYDISERALKVAKQNAATLGIDISLLHVDFLDQKEWANLPVFDIIVSNPPYVPESDRSSMAKNVVNAEPAIALFVPNNNPLIFYRAISEFVKEHLSIKGMIFTEIHENLGNRVVALFQSSGYGTELNKDMQGKERMVKVWK